MLIQDVTMICDCPHHVVVLSSTNFTSCTRQHMIPHIAQTFHFVASLTEIFPCFFLSCKANARVCLAKTGHGPHSSQLVNCVVLCIVCADCVVCVLFVCKCVLYSCHWV
jgi:hypothetical protein